MGAAFASLAGVGASFLAIGPAYAAGTPVVSLGDVSVTEGGIASVPVVFSGSATTPYDNPISVTVQVGAVGDTAVQGVDYAAQPPSITINIPASAPGSYSIPIATIDDTLLEIGGENFTVRITATSGATQGAKVTSTVHIDDNDKYTVKLTQSPDPVVEGGTVSYTATLWENGAPATSVRDIATGAVLPVGSPLTAHVDINSGGFGFLHPAQSADLPASVVNPVTTLAFSGTTVSKTFTVPTADDTLIEPDEQYRSTVVLDNAAAIASITAGSTLDTTIKDNDAKGAKLFLDGTTTVTEGNPAHVTAQLLVLPGYSLQENGGQLKVTLSTGTGTATAPDDYTPVTPGVPVLLANGGSTALDVPTIDDSLVESTETVPVKVDTDGVAVTIVGSGDVSILDNDQPSAVIAIGNEAKIEGNAGQTTFVFPVTLSSPVPAGKTVTLNYATSDGSATAASGDYVAKTGTLVIPAGATAGTISVQVNGDAAVETDETFNVSITLVNNAATPLPLPVISNSVGVGTIVNDDAVVPPPVPTASISAGPAVSEGGSAVYTVTLSSPATSPITVWAQWDDSQAVNWTQWARVIDGWDVQGSYEMRAVKFLAGQSVKTFSVPVRKDKKKEGAEWLPYMLLDGAGYTVAASPADVATVTIKANNT